MSSYSIHYLLSLKAYSNPSSVSGNSRGGSSFFISSSKSILDNKSEKGWGRNLSFCRLQIQLITCPSSFLSVFFKKCILEYIEQVFIWISVLLWITDNIRWTIINPSQWQVSTYIDHLIITRGTSSKVLQCIIMPNFRFPPKISCYLPLLSQLTHFGSISANTQPQSLLLEGVIMQE